MWYAENKDKISFSNINILLFLKIFLKPTSLKQISELSFSVSGQRCGQAIFITVTRFGRGTERALVVGRKKQPFRLFF